MVFLLSVDHAKKKKSANRDLVEILSAIGTTCGSGSGSGSGKIKMGHTKTSVGYFYHCYYTSVEYHELSKEQRDEFWHTTRMVVRCRNIRKKK